MRKSHRLVYGMLVVSVLVIFGCSGPVGTLTPEDNLPKAEDTQPVPNAAASLELTSPADDVTIPLGHPVDITWQITDLPAGATVDLMYQVVGQSGTTTIASDLVTDVQGSFTLDTSILQVDREYEIVVNLKSNGQVVDTATSEGKIFIAMVGSDFVVTTPATDVIVVPSRTLEVNWQGTYLPVGSQLELILDFDRDYNNGNELVAMSEILTSSGQEVSGSLTITGADLWALEHIQPGVFYYVGVRVVKNTQLVGANYAVGTIKLYNGAGLELTEPAEDVQVGLGVSLAVAWTAQSLPSGLTIRIVFVDRETGEEIIGAEAMDPMWQSGLAETEKLLVNHSYDVVARLLDGDFVIVSKTAPGAISIVTSAAIALTNAALLSPEGKVFVAIGASFDIEWTASNAPAAATVAIYLDEDGDFATGEDQIEITPASGVPAGDGTFAFTPQAGEFAGLVSRNYFVIARLLVNDIEYDSDVSQGKMYVSEVQLEITSPSTDVTTYIGEPVMTSWQIPYNGCARLTGRQIVLRLYLDTEPFYRQGQSVEITGPAGLDPCVISQMNFDIPGVAAGADYYVVGRLFLDGSDQEESQSGSPGRIVVPSDPIRVTAPAQDITDGFGAVEVTWELEGVSAENKTVRIDLVGTEGDVVDKVVQTYAAIAAADRQNEISVDIFSIAPGPYLVRCVLLAGTEERGHADAPGRIIVPDGYWGVYDLGVMAQVSVAVAHADNPPEPGSESEEDTVFTRLEGLIFEGYSIEDRVGFEVASLGDLDGDGRWEILVFSRFGQEYTGGNSGAGYLLYGRDYNNETDVPLRVPLSGVADPTSDNPLVEGTLLMFPLDNLAALDSAAEDDPDTGLPTRGAFGAIGLPDSSGDGLGEVVINAPTAAPLTFVFENTAPRGGDDELPPATLLTDHFGLTRIVPTGRTSVEPAHVPPYFWMLRNVWKDDHYEPADFVDLYEFGYDYLPGDIVTVTFDVAVPPATLQFDATVYPVLDTAGAVTLTIIRYTNADETVTVEFATQDMSAIAWVDYFPPVWPNTILTFGGGVTSQTITIPVADVTGDKLFSVKLVDDPNAFPPSPSEGAVLGDITTVLVQIIDAGAAGGTDTIQLGSPLYAALESTGVVIIPVLHLNGTADTVSVELATSDGTATAGADYVAIATQIITFNPGDTMIPVPIFILPDADLEAPEDFTVTLSNPANLFDPPDPDLHPPPVLGNPAGATVTIIDPEYVAEWTPHYETGITISSPVLPDVPSRGVVYYLTSQRLATYRNQVYIMDKVGSPVEDGVNDGPSPLPDGPSWYRIWFNGGSERCQMITRRERGLRFGQAVSPVADIDGDGRPELLISVPHADVVDLASPNDPARHEAGHLELFGAEIRFTSISSHIGNMAWLWPNWHDNTDFVGSPQNSDESSWRVEIIGPVDNAELSGAAGLGRYVTADPDTGAPLVGTMYENGDFNGDGIPDFVAGAPGEHGGDGAVYIVPVLPVFGMRAPVIDLADFNLPTPPGNDPDLNVPVMGVKLTGVTAGGRLGEIIAPAGDFNGDGLADVLIAIPLANPDGKAEAGRMVLMFGTEGLIGDFNIDEVGSAMVARVPGLVLEGEEAGDHLGARICAVYDVNGDGLDDILIAAPHADFADTSTDANGDPIYSDGVRDDCGKIYLIYGKRDIIKTDENTGLTYVDYNYDGEPDGPWSADQVGTLDMVGAVFVGAVETDRLQAISAAGDTNRDGIADFLLGAPFADVYVTHENNPFDNVPDFPAGDNAGKAYLIMGRTLTIEPAPDQGGQ